MSLRAALEKTRDAAARVLLSRFARSSVDARPAVPPAALWSQARGAKKSTRRVDVVLVQDVEGLGRDGEVLSVKPGHARNHLVPAKLAAYATPERLAEAEAKRAEWVEDADAAGADDAVDRETTTAVNVLTRSKLVVKRIASKQTKEPRVPLTAELLVGEILRQRKLEVDARSLLLDAPIATFGEHAVPLWFDRKLVPEQRTLTVSVVPRR